MRKERRVVFCYVSVIGESLLCLVNSSDHFLLFAISDYFFIYLLFLQAKHVTAD